jgi:CDP-glucose 4,6-dehydratase
MLCGTQATRHGSYGIEALVVISARPDPVFWADRRVLVTGHTGFKGAWLCLLLDHLGARVSGIALPAVPDGAFAAMHPSMESHIVDIRDKVAVADAVRQVRPDIVFHLAAQALVGEGHAHPSETFATNVLGTAHVLESLHAHQAAAALVVTSDKVYRPNAGGLPFNEDSPLGGTDPYSASKTAAEHVAACWRARLQSTGCHVSTARAGNVLGGGDCAIDRLAPDVIRAYHAGVKPMLRNPQSVRPWQYVLDVLAGYLLYAQAMVHGDAPPALNFGPDADNAVTAATLAEHLLRALGAPGGWQTREPAFAETKTLRLDCTRAMRTLGWCATTHIDRALRWTAEWHAAARRGDDMGRLGKTQIEAWLAT